MPTIRIAIALLGAIASGCASPPASPDAVRASFAATSSDRHFTASRKGGKEAIGVGLAGGGTRAAATSIGILEGLQEAGILQHADVISSVSGGGYGAYWWYSRFLHDERHYDGTRTAFADCISTRYTAFVDDGHPAACDAMPTPGQMPICPSPKVNFDKARGCPAGDPFRFQNHLRGFQDILSPGTFDYRTIYADQQDALVNFGRVLGHSALASVPNFIANVLFDWQVDLSPSRSRYRQGIGASFGGEPANCHDLAPTSSADCAESRPPSSRELSFEDIHRAWTSGAAPQWVINAHAGRGRSGLDFSAPQHAEETAFEFTPERFGSSVYGFREVADLPHEFSVLDAVVASAAFFTMQQKEIEPPWRNLLNLFFLVSTVNWGVSIPNRNVPDEARRLHYVLPFPLYYAHRFAFGKNSAFIALADGGLTDNLGAYALLKRRIPTWILSDHSYDRSGAMGSICQFRRNLGVLGFDLRVPGLDGLHDVCDDERKPRLGYDAFNWSYPILLACVTRKPDTGCDAAEHRIILIKPALNARLALARAPLDPVTSPPPEWAALVAGCRSDPGSAACHRAARAMKCSARAFEGVPPAPRHGEWTYDTEMPCEVLGFLMVNGFGRGKAARDDCPGFPQNSSTLMTANSSPSLYGAYRELGRWHARQVRYFFDGRVLNTDRFNTVLRRQESHKMTPKDLPSGEPGFLFAAKAGSPSDCMLLEAPR